jgi:DNA-3-methyladenine glycosylase II
MPADHRTAVAHLRKVSPEMRALIDRVGPCRMETTSTRTPFQALLHAIAHQQLHGNAAAKILGRFQALFPNHRFPGPKALASVTDEQLRAVGFSGAKSAAIRDLAEKTLARIVPGKAAATGMSDQELIDRITRVRGIGQWTVEILLMFTLDRPDVWPVDDFGVRAGYQALFHLDQPPKPKELIALGEIFRPHRSVAAWYLWRAAELKNKQLD